MGLDYLYIYVCVCMCVEKLFFGGLHEWSQMGKPQRISNNQNSWKPIRISQNVHLEIPEIRVPPVIMHFERWDFPWNHPAIGVASFTETTISWNFIVVISWVTSWEYIIYIYICVCVILNIEDLGGHRLWSLRLVLWHYWGMKFWVL